MKSCPTCNRTYPDDTLAFCLMDGSVLSAPYEPAEGRQRPETPGKAPVTEIMVAPAVRPETPPRVQSTLQAGPREPPVFQAEMRPHKIAGELRSPSILLRLTFVLRGLCAIAFGLFAIWDQSSYGLRFSFIIYVIIVGTLGIICGVKTYLDYRKGWLLFAEGVFNVGAAVVLLIVQLIVQGFSAYSLLIPAGCIILGAVFQIGATIQLKEEIKGVWPLALSGAASFLLGFALFIAVGFMF